MAFLTKPGTLTKGQEHTFTLGLTELVAKMNSLGASAHMRTQSNWSSISVNFLNEEGQRKQVIISPVTLQGFFRPSDSILANMTIENIVVYDRDGLFFKINKIDLPETDFNLTIAGIVSGGSSAIYSRDYSNPNVSTSPIDQFFGAGSPVLANNKLTISTATTAQYHLNINQIPSSPLVIGTAYKIRLTISEYVTGFNDNSILTWVQGGGLNPATTYTSAQLDAASVAGYIEINYTHQSAIEYLRITRIDNGFANVNALIAFSKIEFILA